MNAMKNNVFSIHKTSLFVGQVRSYITYYKQNAGNKIAEKFYLSLEDALGFISKNPYACPIYDLEEFDDLRERKFRKWNLSGFPHIILFRIMDKNIIKIDAIYAHKMNLSSRTKKDI